MRKSWPAFFEHEGFQRNWCFDAAVAVHAQRTALQVSHVNGLDQAGGGRGCNQYVYVAVFPVPAPSGDRAPIPDHGLTGGHVGRRVIEAPSFRSEEHTSALQSLMRISYAVF